MAILSSTYYGLTRIREVSPDAQDWAAVDGNVDIVSKILKALEQHSHTGTAAMTFPGYNGGTPIAPVLTEYTTGGILPPGAIIGVRLAYVGANGLETDASPETTFTTSSAASVPTAPTLASTAAAGLTGGVYTYAITKRKGTGETTISEVVSISIPYDTTYSVTVGFNAINTYVDGTDGINIYRSAGLNQPFQLLTTVTGAALTTYVDTGTVPSANVNVQPPTLNTFDSNRKIRITWSTLAPHPAAATLMRVYVTQQAGLWSTSHLLSEISLAGTPATYIEYLGNESLSAGWPRNVSQIPASPAKIDLATQTTGSPTLTANMNFAGFQALNMKVHTAATAPSSPTVGMLWYDTSTNLMKGYQGSTPTWVTWGSASSTPITHSAENTGGHIAANIPFSTGSAVNAKTIFDTLRNTDGTRKQTQVPQKNFTIAGTTALTSYATMPGMTVTIPSADIHTTGVWCDIDFSAAVTGSDANMQIYYALEVAGSTQTESIRMVTVPSINAGLALNTRATVQLTAGAARTINVLWRVTNGTATVAVNAGSLVAKVLF